MNAVEQIEHSLLRVIEAFDPFTISDPAAIVRFPHAERCKKSEPLNVSIIGIPPSWDNLGMGAQIRIICPECRAEQIK
jgi:hypothetical protein